jgi:hypothetical protein
MKKKIAKQYDRLRDILRDVTVVAIGDFRGSPEGGAVVAGAQAEALALTLKGFALRGIKKEFHAKYLHRLFSAMLADVLSETPHLTGRLVIVEKRKKH